MSSDLDSTFDPDASDFDPLPEAEIRRILDLWSGRRFFRAPKLGARIHVEQIVSRGSCTVRLRTQWEQRTIHRSSVPYHGGSIDDVGFPPGLWDIAITLPADFVDQVQEFTLPHTERVETCTHCNGMGSSSCGFCGGMGRTVCSLCGGSGIRTQMQMQTNTDAQGNTSTTTENSTTPCVCMGGFVRCTSCGGSGRTTCGTCGGAARLKVCDVLRVTFRVEEETNVVDTLDIPDKEIGRMTGITLIDRRAPQIDTVPPIRPEVDRSVQALLALAVMTRSEETRLLFQRLRVESIPIYEVAYTYHGAGQKRLWICGNERFVYAPHAPLAWGRILLTITLALGLIATLVAVAVHAQH